MRDAALIIGFVIIIYVMFELFWTTMGQGGGPVTKRVTGWMYLPLAKFFSIRKSHRFLSFAGIFIVTNVFFLWVLLLWAGWLLVFLGAESTVINGTTRQAADFWELVYYTGFTLFTLGVGDYNANGQPWLVLTAIASLNGLFVVTFTITYLVPVMQAATQRRQIAMYISCIGLSSQEIILNMWEKDNCHALEQYLSQLDTMLVEVEQQHQTYPVLHYFHAINESEAVSLRIATLDEALTMIELGITDKSCVNEAQFYTTRQILTEYLDTLDTAFIDPADEAPPTPSLELLRDHQVPVISDAQYSERLKKIEKRRKLLLALVRSDGWSWDKVQNLGHRRDGRTPLRTSKEKVG